MKVKYDNQDCNGKKFKCISFEFNYKEDIEKINKFTQDGEELAKQVNPALARNAAMTRKYETIEGNCIAGLIAEYCWIFWLESEARRLGIKINVKPTLFQTTSNQIDILIEYPDGSKRTVEVRSSFPYRGLNPAICRNFDILGWYVNIVKTKEIKKDYYVRAVLPFKNTEFRGKLGGSFSLFLTGGATRNLLETSPHARDKELIPYDDIHAQSSETNATYRVIEPIINGYDVEKITECIIYGNPL